VDYFGEKRKVPSKRDLLHTEKPKQFFSTFLTNPFVDSKTSYMDLIAKGQTVFSWILQMEIFRDNLVE
jgi:hypothetical protein